MNKTTNIIFLLLFFVSFLLGQMNEYSYKRQITGVVDLWHRIQLPNAVFSKIKPDLTDFRIYGITSTNDTIEAPYLLEEQVGKVSLKTVSFKLINQSYNKDGYFYTYKVETEEPINSIKLNFDTQNFDYRIHLMGSQNLNQWYTITENYRILSIKNEITDYQFTKIKIPDSQYRYYRLFITTTKNPQLNSTNLELFEKTDPQMAVYPLKLKKLIDTNNDNIDEYLIQLNSKVPVSYLKINVTDNIDYYRSISILALEDSVKTEKGWKYNYRNLKNTTLSSLEENEFYFKNIIINKIKVRIFNQNNQSLNIESFQVKGFIHYLIARFSEQANYYLVYGNKNARKPRYDISQFREKIPENLKFLNLGTEQYLPKQIKSKDAPLFENKIWLWVIIICVIFVMGWFTLKMIKRTD